MKSRKVFIATGLIIFVTVLVLIFKERPLEDGWIGGRFRPPSIGVPSPRERNIFFVETSCVVHDTSTPSIHTFGTGLVLPPRLACALEAAASAHVDRPVFLVHTCSVDVEDVLLGNAPDYARAAFALPNVFLWPVRFHALFFNSPLAELVESVSVSDSEWLAAHASHLLRHLLLWKYGGTFLDADVLVLKSFGVLQDFASAEAERRLSSSVMDFSWEGPGRLLAETCLNEIVLLQLQNWSINSNEVISRAMEAVCNTKNVTVMDAEKCHGFEILPTLYFYPVSHEEWHRIFYDIFSDTVMKGIRKSYAIHTWSMLSKDIQVTVTSQQAYAQIAWQVCPAVVSNVREYI